MPLPTPRAEETTAAFMDRCLADPKVAEEYPDRDQRFAVCQSLSKGEKDTYTDYPKAATENAKRALQIRDETGNPNDCGTRVGWERANQLADREPLSEDTIERMASFNRHRGNSDGDPTEDCGALMWLAWGGDEGIDWAIQKSEELDKQKREDMELTHFTALAHIAMKVNGNENTLSDIASMTGDEVSTIAMILNGEQSPSEEQANAIAEVLQINESMLDSAMELDGKSEHEEMKHRLLKKSRKSEREDEIKFSIKNIDMTPDAKYANIMGYGSVFGNVDLGGDVVVKGAFLKTLKDKGGKIPFLQDHRYDIDNFLGVITAEEDDIGLKAEMEVNLMTQKGREFYSKAKQCSDHGMDMGLSIGYDIIDSEIDSKTGIMKLKQLRLNEISATLFPMNVEAKITEVKSQITEIEQELSTLKSLLSEPSYDTQGEADLVKQIKEMKGLFNS